MSFDLLTEEQRELRGLVRTLARERIAPRAAEIDESHEFPWDVVELFRESDLFGLFFEERYGGTGTGTLLALVAIEEVSKACATSGLILAVQELGSLGLKLAGTEEQKERFLPRLASGEWLGAYALSEAGAGSDSAALATTARRDGDAYVLDGGKRFITNAGVAQPLHRVRADRAPPARSGITAFVVEADTPGFEVDAARAEDGHRRLDDGRARLRRRARAGGEPARRGGRRASGSRCGSSTARARASAPRASASRRARPTTRSSTRGRARRWAGRSASTS